MNKKVLVIGGAGYLGSVLCRKLLDAGYSVRVLDCLLYGDDGIKDLYDNDKFEFQLGDIRDIQSLMESTVDIDVVIHLAAIVGDPASSLKPEESVDINYLAVKVLGWICKYRKIKRFIFASTCSVYGDSKHGEVLTETSPTNPLSLYSEMKLKSEDALLDLECESFSPTILRMGTLFGISPRMRFDLVINWFVMNAIAEKEITLFGGDQERCFCHIEDAANAYIKCLETPIENISGDIFNVSTFNLKIIDLANTIANHVPTMITVNEKKTDKRSYITTSQKIKEITGWNETKTLVDFIYDIDKIGWGDYKDPIYSNYEWLKLKGLRKI